MCTRHGKGALAMYQTTVKIDGMMCGMCESHINDVIRQNFPVKKVTSSHKKGESVILSEEELDESKLREAIEKTGYQVLSVNREEAAKKKGLGDLFHRK